MQCAFHAKKRLIERILTEDGPLSTRIFIDAFLPSLEGNRIFPLFNYRCAEKIERSDEDFYEKNRKRLHKHLSAVSSTEEGSEEEFGKVRHSCLSYCAKMP